MTSERTTAADLLPFALEVVEAAGKLTQSFFRSPDLEIVAKEDGTPVTQADQGAERLIRDAIAAEFPNDAIMGEEYGATDAASGRQWVIDPIDGTKSFAAGVPLVEALESVAGACGNIVYEGAVLRMRDEVATGQRLQRAMENTELFPNMVNQMIAVGEESGSLDEMSSKVADFYEEEVDNAVDSMSSLLEPLIMSILGVLVGGLVIAMYLPIFKMGQVV